MHEELIQDLRDRAEFLQKVNRDSSIHNSFAETMSQAANAIEELSKPKWIPVTEALPELDKRVFVIGLFGFCGIYSLIQVHDTTCWEDEYGYYQDFEDVTHWMPLPEPPKEE